MFFFKFFLFHKKVREEKQRTKRKGTEMRNTSSESSSVAPDHNLISYVVQYTVFIVLYGALYHVCSCIPPYIIIIHFASLRDGGFSASDSFSATNNRPLTVVILLELINCDSFVRFITIQNT